MIPSHFSPCKIFDGSNLSCRSNVRCDEHISKRTTSETEKRACVRMFETLMMDVHHKQCICCRRVRIKMTINGKGLCDKCKSLDKDYYLKNDSLPVWYARGDRNQEPNFNVPNELSDLSTAEKLLIQRVCLFVPLVHIVNGTLGIKGHSCAFEQDIKELASVLPKRRDEVDMITVEQFIRSEIGSEHFRKKNFRVRRSKVLAALRWLKENNVLCRDITIEESNLDWMGPSGEGYLHKGTLVDDDVVPDEDLGPVPENGKIRSPDDDNVAATGYIDFGGNSTLSQEDSVINSHLQEAVEKTTGKKSVNMIWPDIAKQPVSEFSDTKIFALSFPWLFPGGFGDVKTYPHSVSDWGEHMLFYDDARFSADKVFCFVALNYVMRQRNSSSGNWFVEKFQKDCPETLPELKQRINDGDTRFVNSLTHYNKRMKGSNPYWMHKRSEVYTWINHHVEVGNGAPMFFMTLSCAEYFWADVALMLRDRLDRAGLDSSKCTTGSKGFTQLVNEHAVVVQEYFQQRVETWLDTCGKAMFGIKHYWARCEFAPGRGQIHTHLLAIPDDQEIYKQAQQAHRREDNGLSRASILSQWARENFGLTASVEPGFDNLNVTKEQCPTTIRFVDLGDDESAIKEDQQRLLKAVQCHTCNGFCLKNGKKRRCGNVFFFGP